MATLPHSELYHSYYVVAVAVAVVVVNKIFISIRNQVGTYGSSSNSSSNGRWLEETDNFFPYSYSSALCNLTSFNHKHNHS